MFDFSCGRCGAEFEDLVRADALPSCPACGSDETRKKPSGPAVRAGARASSSRPAFAPGGG
ncbi:MAG TPA: FmdB family zinc ribbon protein [Thermoanaerobaculia bacterium]